MEVIWTLENDIKLKFTKFLLDQKGNLIKIYASTTNPNDIFTDIKKN